MADENKLIPDGVLDLPFKLNHHFDIWQQFAVRAAVPSLVFNLSLAGVGVGLARMVDWPLVCVSVAVGATSGGFLLSLSKAFGRTLEYVQTATQWHTNTLEVVYCYFGNQSQINAFKVGKNSTVNVSQNGINVENTAVIQTTYEMGETYRLAIDLLALAVDAQRHIADGARINKPISFDAYNRVCAAQEKAGAGHERWQSAMVLLGEADCIKDPLKSVWGRESLRVRNVHEGIERMDQTLTERGYIRRAGEWFKK